MANQEEISRTTDEYVQWAKEQLEKKEQELENSNSRTVDADPDLVLDEPDMIDIAEEIQKETCVNRNTAICQDGCAALCGMQSFR